MTIVPVSLPNQTRSNGCTNERVGDGELLLAGGGDADDSWHVDERLVERAGDGATVEYVPVSMPAEKYPDCEEWITSVFEPTPDENHAGITDTTGLGLLQNVDVWCHYEDEEAVRQYAATSGRTVVAVPERSGVSVTADRYEVVGHEPVDVVRTGTTTTYSPGDRFRL